LTVAVDAWRKVRYNDGVVRLAFWRFSLITSVDNVAFLCYSKDSTIIESVE